jgi:hypothetical protein
MNNLLISIILIFIVSFNVQAQKCEIDSLSIDNAILQYINDTSLVRDVTMADTVIYHKLDRKGAFNAKAPVKRIMNLSKELEYLKKNKIIFKTSSFSVSCMNEDYLYDFGQIEHWGGGGMSFYESGCKKIPFVKYYWEYNLYLPGTIDVTILQGYNNCYY